MFDPKLYREACRELTVPEEKMEEIIAMTEHTNKKKLRPLRTALICAAAVAMMVVSVAAAAPEVVGDLWYRVADLVQVGQYRTEMITEEGESMTLLNIPEAWVENRDGRAILVVAGEDAADLTDALASEGRYVYEETDEGAHLVITVTGSIDDWELTSKVGDPGEDMTGLVGYINSSALEKAKAEQDMGHYIVKGDDVEDLDGEVTFSIAITDPDNCIQP